MLSNPAASGEAFVLTSALLSSQSNTFVSPVPLKIWHSRLESFAMVTRGFWNVHKRVKSFQNSLLYALSNYFLLREVVSNSPKT